MVRSFGEIVSFRWIIGLLDVPIQRRRRPYESYDRAARWLCGSTHSLVDFVEKLCWSSTVLPGCCSCGVVQRAHEGCTQAAVMVI